MRGLVLPIAIGVYDEEQGITQKVRFTIEASVGGGVAPKGDHIDEVPSYDDLVGAVKSIVGAGHINLVETLAARIAERCLAGQTDRLGAGARRKARARPGSRRRRNRPLARAVSAISRPTVVKLGGSLSESGRINSILKVVGKARLPCVIVPGGGSFADAVRAAQAEHGFSQAAAHRMAVLAMHQTGMMLCAMSPRLQPVETLAGMRRAVAEQRVPVWLPMKLVDGDTGITRDWKTTSDGLAARLAERLGGAPVVLVKSCRIARSASAARLARDGIVDPTFAAIVERARLSWRVFGSGDEAELADLLGSPHRSGRRTPAARAIARRR